jgi:hypothetical protein
MALALDTLEASKRLKSAGFDETQAEALVGVLRDTREAGLAGLATRDELLATKNELKAEITQLAAAMNTGHRDAPPYKSLRLNYRGASRWQVR